MWSMLGTRKCYVLEGTFKQDSLRWTNYAQIGGKFISHWMLDVINEMPNGEQVRITIEVIR